MIGMNFNKFLLVPWENIVLRRMIRPTKISFIEMNVIKTLQYKRINQLFEISMILTRNKKLRKWKLLNKKNKYLLLKMEILNV